MAKRLRKIAVTATKAYDAELRQIPCAATCKVYKQGATVTTGTSISSGASGTIVVRDTGRVQVGDVLRVNTTASPTLTVTALPSSVGITGTAAGGTFTVVTDDRLVVTSDQPATYRESTGISATASANQFSCSATTGYGYCYVREHAVDIEFSGTGITTRMLLDEETGETRPIVYASDFDTIQEAIDSLPVYGGTVVLPEGTTDITTYAPITVTDKVGVRLVGIGYLGLMESGAGGPYSTAGTVLSCTDANKNILELDNASYFEIENMVLKGAGSAGTQIGLKAYWSSTNTVVPSIMARRLHVMNCGSHGTSINNYYLSTWDNCHFTGCKGSGFTTTDTSLGHPHFNFFNCWFNGNVLYGLEAYHLNVGSFIGCSFQINEGAAQTYLEDCSYLSFMACQWEEIDTGSGNLGLLGWRLSGCEWHNCKFINSSYAATANKAAILHQSHHCVFDDIFMDKLNTTGGSDGLGIHLVDGCYKISIGQIQTPNGGIDPIVGTEASDFTEVYVTVTQQYANDTARDAVVAPANLYPCYKIKGALIYVLTPTSPATAKLQYWDGSAWKGIAVV